MPDRIYSVQYNGRIYDVRAAETSSPDEIFSFVRQQAGGGGGPTGPKEEENLLEKIPVVGGLLAGAADIPLNVVSGLASTGKSLTDVFGAGNTASGMLDTVAKYAESLTSAQSREDEKTAAAIRKAAEGKGIWEEVKAAASSFAVNPLDTLANVTGSALPFAAAAAAAPGTGGASLAPLVALGAASGVGTVKGSISDAVYARAKEAGVPDAEAKAMAEEAQSYGGKNLDQVALGGALGAVASATGFDKVLGRAIAKRAIEDVVEGAVEKEATRGLARRVTTGAGAEAIPEAAQAGQERFAQNLAEQREGYETDLMAGVAGQAAFEGLAGGVLGGIGGIPGQSAPGPIATDEEILSERQGFEADIEATGMPEAQDPAIRARAAELMQSLGVDPVGAVERAIYQRDQQAATRQAEREEDSDGLDVGRGEPSLSVSDATDSGEGLAGEPTESGTGPVEVAGAPTGRSNVQEVESADPLGAPAAVAAPISVIPPIDQVSPKAQITEQLAPAGQAAPTATPVPEAAPTTPAPIQTVEEAAPIAPTPIAPTPIAPTPIAPTPITPTPIQAVEEAGTEEVQQVEPKVATNEEVEAAIPDIQQMFNDAGIDFEDAYGVTELDDAQKAQAARIIVENPEVDAYDAIDSVLKRGIETPAPAAPPPVMALPKAKKLVTPERIIAATEMLNTTLTTPDFEGFKVTPKQINVAAQRMVRTPGLDAPSALSNVLGTQAAPAPEQKVSDIAGTLEQNIAAPTTAPVVEDVPGLQLPPEVQELQKWVDTTNPGFEVRYRPDNAKPYTFGVPGLKDEPKARYTSIGALKNRIKTTPMLKPKKVVEGVEVNEMPAGDAGGLNKPTRSFQLQPEKPSIAGKLLPAQQEQIDLLKFEIDAARKEQQINDAQRSELVNMLRTPSLEEMDIYRSGLSNAEKAKRRELRSVWLPVNRIQNEIDKLKAEGNQLGTEEKLLEKQEGLTEPAKAVKKKQFAKRAKDIAKRTKVASAELSEAKSGVYKRARQKLRDAKRKPLMQAATLKIQLAEGKINKQQYDRMVRDLKPEPYMFRQATGKAIGITLEELNDAVKAITSRWGARLEPKMVQSVADLPPAIREELEKLGRTDSFGFYKDGKAYLIADNMNGVEDVAPTLYHEALGHLGLRARFREGLDAILDDIYRTNKGVAALADKFLSANKNLYSKDENPTARAVEEVLASASEAGPLRASRMDKLMKYIKDFARKYLGFAVDFKFSDREVRTILAMAHQQALSGEGTVMGSSSMMFSSPEQKKAKDATADAQSDIDINIEKYATTTADQMDMESYSKGLLGSIGDIVKGKSLKNWLGGLMSTTASTGWIGRGGLNFMPTDGTLDYADTKIAKATADALREAVDAADKMNGTRSTTRRVLNRIVADLKNYLLSNSDPIVVNGKKLKALPVAMDYGNGFNIDMVKLMDAKSIDDALKTDQIWRKYTKLLKDPDLTPAKKKDFGEKLAKREGEIAGAMKILSKLSKEGRSVYTRVRNMNRDMHDMRQYYMSKRIENLRDAGLSEESISKMAIAIRAEQERLNDKVNAPSKEDAHNDYPDIPLGLFHREYFPKRRYGDYWLRIKKTKFGEPILKFFETPAERDADWESAAVELGVNKNDKNYFDLGNDAQSQLGDDFDTENAFLKVLNKISEINVDTFTEAKKSQLRNDVYQLHLLSTPEGSGRKQFIKSKNRLGWSSDILRTVGTTAEEYASDIARLQFVPDIDRAIAAAKKSIESIPADQKAMARDFITNIESRIQGEMEPQPKGFANKIVPWANQLAFVSFLTAPATALVQVTALPMRVAPNLWGKYGMANTARVMGRYMNVFKNMPKLESNAKAQRKTYRTATLMEAPNIKNSGRHRDALTRATDEYGLIMPLSEFTMGQERTPQTAAQGGFAEVRQKVYDAMTYLFDTSEQLTREIAFMSTYDLEYDRLADAGLSPEERQNKAIIAAKDTVNYTLGNYSSLNRPPVMKGSELARALFLFKQYSVITTRFFVQATRAIFGKNTPRDERVAAMKEMTGVLGMGFLMGGVVGLPLYTLGMMTLQALQDATDDDEDRKERMKKNPLTADSVEMQFRYEWLPEHFGAPTVTAEGGKKINLSDIILNGAVSEATGWNFGSRVSLDLAGMWFRAPRDADTWSQTVNNALVENIPGASASMNIVSMGEEFSKGNVLKGLEYLPAMVRAPIKAYRLSTEGVRTQNEKIKLAAEDISNGAIIGAVLGFNPTQVAKVQQQNRDVLNSRSKLNDQKTELLGAYKQAVRRIQNGDADGQEQAREAFEDIMEYNKKVGHPYYGISYANMYRSLTGSAAEAKYDVQGMGLNQLESEYAKQLGIGQ